MRTKITKAEIEAAGIGISTFGKSKGNYIIRKEFFYRHDGTVDNTLVAPLRKAFPEVKIIDKGEHWARWSGGASTRNSCHWWVVFNFSELDADLK